MRGLFVILITALSSAQLCYAGVSPAGGGAPNSGAVKNGTGGNHSVEIDEDAIPCNPKDDGSFSYEGSLHQLEAREGDTFPVRISFEDSVVETSINVSARVGSNEPIPLYKAEGSYSGIETFSLVAPKADTYLVSILIAQEFFSKWKCFALKTSNAGVIIGSAATGAVDTPKVFTHASSNTSGGGCALRNREQALNSWHFGLFLLLGFSYFLIFTRGKRARLS